MRAPLEMKMRTRYVFHDLTAPSSRLTKNREPAMSSLAV
jgi:hypothetical protein